MLRRVLLVSLLLALPATAGEIEHVVVVSVDGLRPTYYLEPDRYGLKIPTLRRLLAEGAYARGMRSVFPTVTYPAHTSMVTGVSPARHGIFLNSAADPQMRFGLRWYVEDVQAKTLYQAAEEKGLRTALVYWPATLGAQVDAVFPEFWRGDRDDHQLLKAISTPGLVEGVEQRFPDFQFHSPAEDEVLTDVAVHIIHSLRPHLLFLHIFQVDHQQHAFGPASPEALAAVEEADRQLGRLVAALEEAGLWEQTALFVVSDHGFAPVENVLKPGVLLRRAGLLEVNDRGQITEWRAAPVCGGATCEILLKDPNDAQTRREVLAIFSPLAEDPASGLSRLYSPEETAELSPDLGAFLILEAAPPFALSARVTGEFVEAYRGKATHGFDPERPDMLASFLVAGPAVKHRRLERVSLLDLAPTIAYLLELDMPEMEGRALRELFELTAAPP
ncbi:MAG: ectonucleotide pyrophosphatase/phosphodiesterase [Candidatus Acidoferrales bacterium]